MLSEAPKPTNEAQASVITDELPVCISEADVIGTDLISLCDIVVTGIEVPAEWNHFRVHKYDPKADGIHQSWGVLGPLQSAGKWKPDGSKIHPIELWARVVRKAVYDYLLDRLNRGMDLSEARLMVNGSYTDAVVADSILQFALYGQEVYS